MDICIGCSSWSYSSWVGPFYPIGADSRDFLRLYGGVFDTVEIDSSFYRSPPRRMTQAWENAVPAEFVFTAKMPKLVTHDRQLIDCELPSESFIDTMEELGTKLGAILIQLPPSFKYQTEIGVLKDFLQLLPFQARFAIEFRHRSWFRDDVFSRLQGLNIALCWSEIPFVNVPDVVTTDMIYLRLIGDRSIAPEDFGRIQKDRAEAMKKWSERLLAVENEVRLAYVFANNHFAGFGPGTVNLFRKLLGLPEIDWEQGMDALTLRKLLPQPADEGQMSLLDFGVT